MWQSIKAKLTDILAVAVGILAALFFLEKSEKDSAEAKDLTQVAADKDKELQDQQAVLEQNTKQVEQQAAQEEKAPMTQQESLDELNKL
jgi:hypothetical protein